MKKHKKLAQDIEQALNGSTDGKIGVQMEGRAMLAHIVARVGECPLSIELDRRLTLIERLVIKE